MAELRVLHVAQPLVAGVPNYVADLAQEQQGRGWDVVVASPPGGALQQHAAERGIPWHPWDATRSPGPASAGETRRLAALIAQLDPDVVHLHAAKAGLAGRLAVRGRRTTVFQPNAWSFFAVGGPLRAATVAWERFAARWTHAIVCVAQSERANGEAVGVRGPYRVIPNGVDLDRFAPAGDDARAAARRELGIGPDVPLAVCVGRLDTQKNQHALLDAWPAVRARVPGAEVALVGDGPHRGELEARGVEGVRFVGDVSDVRPWLNASSLVAQPSAWEGLSFALLEAMATARAVVVTDVPGMRDAVDGSVGAIVPPGETGALAAAIAERLADPKVAAREGAAARARVEDRFDGARNLALVSDIYAELRR